MDYWFDGAGVFYAAMVSGYLEGNTTGTTFDVADQQAPAVPALFVNAGPQPKAFAIGAKHARKETDEYRAVMIDTRFPLEVAALPDDVENRDYVDSWKAKAG